MGFMGAPPPRGPPVKVAPHRQVTIPGARSVEASTRTASELLKAADELDIKPLLDLLCAHIAAMLKGESAVEQLKQVTYSNDFTDEELASFRAENKWLEAV